MRSWTFLLPSPPLSPRAGVRAKYFNCVNKSNLIKIIFPQQYQCYQHEWNLICILVLLQHFYYGHEGGECRFVLRQNVITVSTLNISSKLRLSLTCSLEWPLRELSLANYLLFRFYLTLYTMKGQSRAEN